MSDCKDQHLDSTLDTGSSKLYTCLFSTHLQLTQSVKQILQGDHYILKCFNDTKQLLDFISHHKEEIDCIILVSDAQLAVILKALWRAKILLPTIIIETEEYRQDFINPQQLSEQSSVDINNNVFYHQAEILLYPTQLKEITSYINLAITKFLTLTSDSEIDSNLNKNESDSEQLSRSTLTIQQRRLTNKIKERLGYLGVYYKRNANDFYRNLSPKEQQKLDHKLNDHYRTILLNYFEDDCRINQLIDEFVDLAFFADISTSQILEIHMDLIDEFSHQLQIEGRNDDILLDYRLTLIDVISHFCEIYRRSIPEEDVSLELLFGVK